MFCFFFKQKTAYERRISDWSSDVCSSDLLTGGGGEAGGLPWLVAPLGASAVLVFAVPASPLAQPWPVIGGNLLSAAVGIFMGQVVGTPLIAAGMAAGAAIALMSLGRCLHPPGGACALLCALGATGPEAWGWGHLLPIAANLLAPAGTGWLYHNLPGHPWPHSAVRQPAPRGRALCRDSGCQFMTD